MLFLLFIFIFLVDIDKLILKCVEVQSVFFKNTFEGKKNKVRGLILPDFELYYKATVIKIVKFNT